MLQKSKGKGLTFNNVGLKFETIWDGVLHENFTFSFLNNMQISACTQVEQEYQKISL